MPNALMDYARTLTIDPDEYEFFKKELEEHGPGSVPKPKMNQIKFGMEQEICKKGHTDEWVLYAEHGYKICRKCELENNQNIRMRSTQDLANFGRSMNNPRG